MAQPELVMLVGGNGAGKSTFYQRYLASSGIPLVNADVIAKEVWPEDPEAHSYEAAAIAAEQRAQLLLAGHSFCFETVFSHASKIDFIATARSMGYRITMYVFHLEGTQTNVGRVAQRVRAGGHSVPEDKISARIPRTLNHVGQVLPLVDRAIFFDNSSAERPYRLLAQCIDGVWRDQEEAIPDWLRDVASLAAR